MNELKKKIKKIADYIEVGRTGAILDIDTSRMILNELKYEKLLKENAELKKQLPITREKIIEVLEEQLYLYTLNKIEIDNIGRLIEPEEYHKLFNQIASEILEMIMKNQRENEIVIFKVKLTNDVNLSKVIEQILYPKYIGKTIIIREVKE